MGKNIETLCKEKELELLKKYFGNLTKEAAIDRPETIGEYTKDLPYKIEAEFREYLAELWKEYSYTPLVLDEQKLRSLITENSRKEVMDA